MNTITLMLPEDWKPTDVHHGAYQLSVCPFEYFDYEDNEPDCRRYSIDYRMSGTKKWLLGSGCALSVDRCLRDTARSLWHNGIVDKNTAIQFLLTER